MMQKKTRYTKEQSNIIRHLNKAALVNSGPGTGKSETIIGKIKHALDKGLKPIEILVLIFNVSAKIDFVTRLQKQLGPVADGVNVHTLHSFGLFIIQQHYQKLGFTSSPEVIENKAARNSKQYKLDANKVDYDDMLAMPLQLFDQYPAILREVASQFSCLLVDELQDINQQQAQLIELLANEIQTTILVGDKKQLIYGFRGANVQHWNRLVKRLVPKQFFLTRTFRIPEASLPFVNSVAGSFSDDKALVSSVEGYKPSLYRFTDSDAQANYIAQEIQRLLNYDVDVDINDIACLSKTNIPLQQLKLALETRGIEAVESNYSSSIPKWIRTLRSLIHITRWIASKQTSSSPNYSINRIIKLASIPIEEREVVFERIIKDGINGLKMGRSADKSKKHLARLKDIRDLRKAITTAAEQSDTQAAIQILIDVLMKFVCREESRCKYQIQRELCRIKLQVRGLEWEKIKIRGLKLNVSETGVTLSTIHGAKGKEWPYVFLIHVTEDEFSQDKDDYALMYTAMTRHSWKLYLLETPRKNNLFNKEGKLLRRITFEESSIIAPYVKYLKNCYKTND